MLLMVMRNAGLRLLLLMVLALSSARAETLSVVGDSLSAGYGVALEEAWPALVEARLQADGHGWRVINAGVSGDTTKGGLARLDWILRAKPDAVVVELGGNDGLRGLPVPGIEANLVAIIERLQAAEVQVLLVGVELPPNFGTEYTEAFTAMFPRVAKRCQVPLYPSLVTGVGGVPELNQADGIHPNAAGQVVIAERIYPFILAGLGLTEIPASDGADETEVIDGDP